jgi:murein DD-endopeptidase MepM/ murein hydrolase activator NlpD
MGKKSSRRRRKGPKASPLVVSNNFVVNAGPGCYIARRDVSNSWMLEWEDNVDPNDFDGQEVPDVALDPQDRTITLCNVSDAYRVAYVTIYETTVRGASGKTLSKGIAVDNEGNKRSCLTFIVLCPPRTFAHLCSLDLPEGKTVMDVMIDSDVQDWNEHPNPDDEHSQLVGFPLESGPYLCTQGEGGQLTHFFSGNLHAIDFRCPIGTPLLAVADGVIVDSQDKHTLTGVAVSNLFQWNSILLEIDCEEPLLVEYVHISKSMVALGDRVTKGQVIGESGSVGFSPEPHLHFCAYRSREPTAPTVRVQFESENGIYLPVAGEWYTAAGPTERH